MVELIVMIISSCIITYFLINDIPDVVSNFVNEVHNEHTTKYNKVLYGACMVTLLMFVTILLAIVWGCPLAWYTQYM